MQSEQVLPRILDANWNVLPPAAQRAEQLFKRDQKITTVALALMALLVCASATGVICFTAIPVAAVAALSTIALAALAISYWKFVVNRPNDPSAAIQRAREEKNLLRQTYDHAVALNKEPEIRKEIEKLDAEILVFRPLQKRAWIEQLEKEIAEKKKTLEQDSLLKRHQQTYEELEGRENQTSISNRALALRYIDKRVIELDALEKKEIDPLRESLKLWNESYALNEQKIARRNALNGQLQNFYALREAALVGGNPLNAMRIQMLQATTVDAIANLFQRALQDVDGRLEEQVRRP